MNIFTSSGNHYISGKSFGDHFAHTDAATAAGALFTKISTTRSTTLNQLTIAFQRPGVSLYFFRSGGGRGLPFRLDGTDLVLLSPLGDVRNYLFDGDSRQFALEQAGAVAHRGIVFREGFAALELAGPLVHHLQVRVVQSGSEKTVIWKVVPRWRLPFVVRDVAALCGETSVQLLHVVQTGGGGGGLLDPVRVGDRRFVIGRRLRTFLLGQTGNHPAADGLQVEISFVLDVVFHPLEVLMRRLGFGGRFLPSWFSRRPHGLLQFLRPAVKLSGYHIGFWCFLEKFFFLLEVLPEPGHDRRVVGFVSGQRRHRVERRQTVFAVGGERRGQRRG